MRFMIIVRATPAFEAGAVPAAQWVAAMADYHEQLSKAGALLDANGLHPTWRGWRIRYAGGSPQVVDGPFTETQELIAGYTLIQARSREEALEWTRRLPAPFDDVPCEVEVRQVVEPGDYTTGAAVEHHGQTGLRTAGPH